MKRFTIDRSKWACGDVKAKFGEDAYTALLDPASGAMCCLGFYAASCGFAKKDLLDISFPSHILGFDKKPSLKWLTDVSGALSNQSCIAQLNDDETLSQNTREARIRAEFAKHNIEVEFVGRSPRARKTA
jgi:hypothetical protein